MNWRERVDVPFIVAAGLGVVLAVIVLVVVTGVPN
jgi:hypothetical protein